MDNGETVLDFSLEANVFNNHQYQLIKSLGVDYFLDQAKTHYILLKTYDSLRFMAKPLFILRLCSKVFCDLKIMFHVLFILEVHTITSDSFLHFTDTAKICQPNWDFMFQSNAMLWQEPVYWNPLGSTMIFKYKIDWVKNGVTSKCCLCLSGDWQKEAVDFFKNKHNNCHWCQWHWCQLVVSQGQPVALSEEDTTTLTWSWSLSSVGGAGRWPLWLPHCLHHLKQL